MASTSNFEAKVLMSKGKRATAAYLLADCSNPGVSPRHLNEVLDNLLNPAKPIDEWDTIDWCKWLISGGRTPDEFASTVRVYDNATTCGLVWTPNFVAYRCRTCGISPCMSLCTECFKKGNHQRHDFNMFLSQAGGACDCGDTSVMKETGFCDRHGPNKGGHKGSAPSDLMCVADAMMPRIILRLIQHLRENSKNGCPDTFKVAIRDADSFITMLLDFNNMGGLMRRVMTTALTNPQRYRELNEIPATINSDYAAYVVESHKIYEEALRSVPNPEPLEEYRDCPSLQEQLVHRTFLEELVFWTVKFEFPQKVVCLLLHMLPDPDYKEALTKAFVLHYSRIPMMLEKSTDPDTLSNRVVHVSVQLFSNESLALRMTEQLNLLHVMVVSLKYMVGKILIQNTLHDPDRNFHLVVDCAKRVMKEHCYWPLVSDLNNVLSHRPVALRFMADDRLLEMWFNFLAMFQGMNVNQREMNQHVEFEPNTYYAAFSAELEASAYPMWALVSHLKDESTAPLTRRVLSACLSEFRDWLEAINFTGPEMEDSLQVSFHLPLHRYLAVFLCQAVAKQGITLDEVLPSSDTLKLLMCHPLRVQVAFYEILNGLWVRNGLQIKGQAMTYIQCNFCNAMVDADLYLLQICSTRIPAREFLDIVINKFHVRDWMSLAPYQNPAQNPFAETDNDTPMLESFLTFLATLVSVRTNLGLSEIDLNRLEMVTLLCTGDKTHSQLLEQMPERYGTTQSRDFETLLDEVGAYKSPTLEPGGTMHQGMYVPRPDAWDRLYDPVHVLLRAVHRRDFQTSMDRYTAHAKANHDLRPGTNLWPPFRMPAQCSSDYEDPRAILKSRVFHAVAVVVLYKAVRGHVSEQVMALIVFLLEQAIVISQEVPDLAMDTTMCPSPGGNSASSMHRVRNDKELADWFVRDNIFENMTQIVGRVSLTPESEVSPMTYNSDSESEWDSNEMEPGPEGADARQVDLLALDVNPRPVDNIWQNHRYPLLPIGYLPRPDEPSTSQQQAPPLSDDYAMAVALPSRNHDAEPSSPSSPPALPAPHQLRALIAGNEVGRVGASSSKELVPAGAAHHRKTHRRRATIEGRGGTSAVSVSESVVSLLLKLHSHLSGAPDSFDPDAAEPSADAPLLGDGPYYIARLLRRAARADDDCRRCIDETRRRLWPTSRRQDAEKNARDTKEREERRRRAKERQQKLMAEFASKQKQFMEKMEESDVGASAEPEEEQMLISDREYDCVICNQSTPSTDDKPMGLVVLIQATGVIGHRRRDGRPERRNLPLGDDDNLPTRLYDTLSSEFERRVDEMNRNFDPQSWFLAVNLGWDGGVHVQTCGHHLHLDCLNAYLNSLRSQQRQPSLSPEKGEYLCPLCRQLANSVLPLSPQLGECTQVVKSKPARMSQVIDELSNFLRENDPKPNVSNMSEAIGKVMDDMSSSTQLKPIFKARSDKPLPQSLFLFIMSIARTNLEVELVQRGGSLVGAADEPPNPLLPKRDCIVPLLHVLAVHARVAQGLAKDTAWMSFEQLCCVQSPKGSLKTLAPLKSEVPLLLRDPVAILLQFVLLLPLHLDQIYLTTTVQLVYNLLYYQVVLQVVMLGLTSAQRYQLAQKIGANDEIVNVQTAMAFLEEIFGSFDHLLFVGGNDEGDDETKMTDINVVALEQHIQELCLPFLRIASLLKYHLYGVALPDVRAAPSEFVRLIHYLDLLAAPTDWDAFNAASALRWPRVDDGDAPHRATPASWCRELAAFLERGHAGLSLVEQHVRWHQPRLLQLPREYERIFTYYHERPCTQCHSVPQETSICLLCGAIVCLKQNCCKQQNVCEAVAHALECGAGTGVFLVVTSTYIIVIRGHRACLWGSLYLDDYEEEDRDLKRGKPLYLSQERFRLLEQQWLAHRFDHTKKNWVLHRNAL